MDMSDYCDEPCECEDSCMSDADTHLTSTCINVNTNIVCDEIN